MAPKRITDEALWDAFAEVARLLNEDFHMPSSPTLHVGDHLNKITNKMIVEHPGLNSISISTQVWPDGMAGITKRDCYNALRITRSILSVISEAQQFRRIEKARAEGGVIEVPEGRGYEVGDALIEDARQRHEEKLYLVCEDCGEAFDAIETAHAHECEYNADRRDWIESGYKIKPESEAM